MDNGSSANILFWEALIKMGINQVRLRGFSSEMVQLLESITLPMTFKTRSLKTTTMANFLVVKANSSCDAIIGQLTLNNLKLETSK